MYQIDDSKRVMLDVSIEELKTKTSRQDKKYERSSK